MTQNEIADRYIRRGTSITILAELNAVSVDQIREIKQEVLELEYTAVVELMQRLSDESLRTKKKER